MAPKGQWVDMNAVLDSLIQAAQAGDESHVEQARTSLLTAFENQSKWLEWYAQSFDNME